MPENGRAEGLRQQVELEPTCMAKGNQRVRTLTHRFGDLLTHQAILSSGEEERNVCQVPQHSLRICPARRIEHVLGEEAHQQLRDALLGYAIELGNFLQ